MFNKITNLSNYLIEDNGKVFSLHKKDYIKLYKNNYGYYFVSLKTDDGKWKSFFIHRLVAEAFIPNPKEYPVVMHLDDDPSNNQSFNLRWGTQSDNCVMCIEKKRNHGQNKWTKNPLTWTLKDPHGNIHTTNNLTKFCLENNLNQGAMRKTLLGLQGRTQHKGWTRA